MPKKRRHMRKAWYKAIKELSFWADKLDREARRYSWPYPPTTVLENEVKELYACQEKKDLNPFLIHPHELVRKVATCKLKVIEEYDKRHA